MIAIGIDIGGTSTKVGFINQDGEILDSFVYKPKKGISQTDYIDELGDELNNFIISKHYFKEDISGIGVGCPGAINSKTGICDYSNNLDWHFLPVVKMLEVKTGLKCKITNDANAATLGEARFGSGKSLHNIVLLTIGTGIGGGLYINDQLYEGNEGKGAELGHVKLVYDGEQCTCGMKGCIEAYCSCTALIRETKRKMSQNPDSKLWDLVKGDINNVDGKTAWDAEALGDKAAHEVIEQYLIYLSEAILDYCNIFRPDAIILAGAPVNQGDNLLTRVRDYVKKWNYGFNMTPPVEVKISSLGSNAGMIGAACLVM